MCERDASAERIGDANPIRTTHLRIRVAAAESALACARAAPVCGRAFGRRGHHHTAAGPIMSEPGAPNKRSRTRDSFGRPPKLVPTIWAALTAADKCTGGQLGHERRGRGSRARRTPNGARGSQSLAEEPLFSERLASRDNWTRGANCATRALWERARARPCPLCRAPAPVGCAGAAARQVQSSGAGRKFIAARRPINQTGARRAHLFAAQKRANCTVRAAAVRANERGKFTCACKQRAAGRLA